MAASHTSWQSRPQAASAAAARGKRRQVGAGSGSKGMNFDQFTCCRIHLAACVSSLLAGRRAAEPLERRRHVGGAQAQISSLHGLEADCFLSFSCLWEFNLVNYRRTRDENTGKHYREQPALPASLVSSSPRCWSWSCSSCYPDTHQPTCLPAAVAARTLARPLT